MYCIYCGEKIKEGYDFCPECGRPLVNPDTLDYLNEKIKKLEQEKNGALADKDRIISENEKAARERENLKKEMNALTEENQDTEDNDTEKVLIKSDLSKQTGTPDDSIVNFTLTPAQESDSEVQGKKHEAIAKSGEKEKSRTDSSISDAVGRVCVECGSLTYDENIDQCSKCGGKLIPTGYTSKGWEKLSVNEKVNIMHKLVPALFNDNKDAEKVVLNKDEKVEKRREDKKAAIDKIVDKKEVVIQNHMYEQKITSLEKKVEGLENRTKALTIVLIIVAIIVFLRLVF